MILHRTSLTDNYTLSLHDALPIFRRARPAAPPRAPTARAAPARPRARARRARQDWKSTRLNSSHGYISYAVFCLKKKIINLGITAYDLLPFACLHITQSVSASLLS